MQIKKFLKESIEPIKVSNERNPGLVNPKTLPTEIISVLEERIGDEYTAYYFYRNAANWCKDKNYKKAAQYFESEASSELEHSKGLQDYLTQWNTVPSVPQVETTANLESLVDIINKAYTLEYNLLLKYSKDQQSFTNIHPATFNFIQKYVDVQNDSVSEYSDLLNALNLIDYTDKFQILYFEQTYF